MENYSNNNLPPSSSSPTPPPPLPLHSSADAASTTDLFGLNDSQKSSSNLLASLFPPPSLFGENTTCILCSYPIKYEDFNTPACSIANGTSAENATKNTEVANNRRSIFHEIIDRCPLTSSIFYGGQDDIDIKPSSDLTYKSYNNKYFMKKDPSEDPNLNDPRGDWWQGSLYY